MKSGGNDLHFRAFDAINGNAGPRPRRPRTIARTSPHPYVVHDGTHYAAAWVHQSGSDHSVFFRIVGQGTGPMTVKTGATEIRTSHLAWNSRGKPPVVVWCEVDGTNGDSVKLRFRLTTAVCKGMKSRL